MNTYPKYRVLITRSNTVHTSKVIESTVTELFMDLDAVIIAGYRTLKMNRSKNDKVTLQRQTLPGHFADVRSY